MRLISFASLIPALLLATASPAAAQPSPPLSPAARAAWGLDASDLAPHPAVRFGLLGNGMRYAIMRSDAPPGGLSVRLRIDVGAAVEGPREQGFVHLIEHMIFHGSETIPEGALPLMLAHRGLQRWTDFNAFTSYDETVYRLDMGRSDAAARETAFVLMREIAGRLRFTARNVRGAKEKVAEEIADRDAVQDRLASAQNAFLLPGSPLDRGPVAGTRASIGRASADRLRNLYARTYRPSRTVLVVVGDFDPDVAEREIAAHFGDWSGAPAEAAPRPSFVPAPRGTEAQLFVDRAAPTAVAIASVKPVGSASDTGARRDAHLLERVASLMLKRRLDRIGAAPDAPLARADAAVYTHFSTARVASLDLVPRGRDWRGALTRAAGELRDALRSGFSAAELEEALAVLRKDFARDAVPRTATALADAILDAAGRGLVYTAPGDPAAMEPYLARIRLADVNAALRAVWGDPDRLIFVSHNRKIEGGKTAILSAWTHAFRD